MQQSLTEAKEKHSIARAIEQERISNNPVRHVPRIEVPASAQVVYQDKEWYKSFAKLSLFALLFVSACAASVSIALAYVMTRPPETLSYLMDEDGRVVKLESERNPSLTETEVLNWAAKKISDIHKLSFSDYVDHIQSQRADFTDQAFIEYQKALLASKSLEKVKSDRLVMWSEPKEAPKIIEAKVVNGIYTWVVQMKIIQYLGGGEYIANGTEMTSTMVIERTSRARNLSGVVISKYLAKEIGS
jgi:hypothetical protein